jgi:hypothetical protein
MSASSASASTPAYPPADHHEREQPLPQRRVDRGVGRVQPRQHVVAQEDGLADGLERDALLGEPGDRERARDRAGRDDEHVEAERRDVAVGQLDRDLPGGVADRRDPPGEHLALAQHPPQGHHDVARLDGARRRLGEERLVGHVRLRVDDGDLGLATAQLLLQPQRRVHADVPAADDDDPGCPGHVSMFPLARRAHLVMSVTIQSTPAAAAAARSTASSIAGVSRPVNVFCCETW